ncbi:MAG: adenosylcobinamide-phosphate synthase CbiB [Geminocystis sp.]|nr:adenosylcobinamide-phosphate synthase CbiB [Geminocystis sp.]HIK37581.1 cobalamin biosynthesis protein [Geminocystis sp. M7585_C2015_104]
MLPHYTGILSLWLASLLDYCIGDPWNWPHPVKFIGGVIHITVKFILHHVASPVGRRVWGVILAVFLVVASGGVSWLIVRLAWQINPWLGGTVEVVLLASCFAGRSLRQAAEDVLQHLPHNLENARSRLSLYVGRDTDKLSLQEVYRAVLETVAENTTDGVTAPLFYALVGLFIPSIGSVPMAMAYKTISTLDSMIGYKRPPYQDIGWFSAKLEDYATWLPCRLTVLTVALMSGRPLHCIRKCRRDAIKDPSPNSGWSEGIFAVVLGVQLGGVNFYKGEKKIKPLLGEPYRNIDASVIRQALGITRYCFLLWLFSATIVKLLLPHYH